MEKQSRSRGSSKDVVCERGSSTSWYSGGRRSLERWERGERTKQGEDGNLEEKRRSKTAERTSSRVEKFSFTEEQWKLVEMAKRPEGGSSVLGRRSKTTGREKLGGGSDVLMNSNIVGRELLENGVGVGRCSTARRSRTAARLILDESLGGGTSAMGKSRTAGRVNLEERLGGPPHVVRRSKTQEDLVRGSGLADPFGRVGAVGSESRNSIPGRRDLRHRLSGVDQTSGNSLLCRHFKQGRCTWGEQCKFIHVVERSPGAIQPESKGKRQHGIQYFENSSTSRGTFEKIENNVSNFTESKPKDGENNRYNMKDSAQESKKVKVMAEVQKLENAVSLHIEMGKKGGKPGNDQELVEKDKKTYKVRRLVKEVQGLEEEITLQRGNKKLREGEKREATNKARLIDEVQRLEEAVRRKQKQTALLSQTSPRSKQKKQNGRKVIMKGGNSEVNIEKSECVLERKAMSPITRFLESEDARSPPNCSEILDKPPKSCAAAAETHADVGSPGAVSSQSVTSEENPIQQPVNLSNHLTREVKEVEQRWPLNDTLEMCLSEREMEELHSGLVHQEGSSENAFGDYEGKYLVKNGLQESQSSRHQLQQKVSVKGLLILICGPILKLFMFV